MTALFCHFQSQKEGLIMSRLDPAIHCVFVWRLHQHLWRTDLSGPCSTANERIRFVTCALQTTTCQNCDKTRWRLSAVGSSASIIRNLTASRALRKASSSVVWKIKPRSFSSSKIFAFSLFKCVSTYFTTNGNNLVKSGRKLLLRLFGNRWNMV